MYQYCGMCGTRIREDLRFCPNCGASLAEQNEPEEPSKETAAAEEDKSFSEEAENPFLFTGEEIPVVKQEQDGFYIDDLPAAESINKRTDTVQPLKRKKSLMPGILTIVLIFAALVVFGIILNKNQTSRTASEETEPTAQLTTKSSENNLSNEIYSLLYYIDEKTNDLQYDDPDLLTEEKNALYAMVQTLRNKLDTLITDSTKTSLLEHLDSINDSLNNISAIPEKDPNDISYDEYHAAEYSGHYTAVIEMNNISKEHIRATVSLLQLLLQDKLPTKELLPEEELSIEPVETTEIISSTEGFDEYVGQSLEDLGFYDLQDGEEYLVIYGYDLGEGSVQCLSDSKEVYRFFNGYYENYYINDTGETVRTPSKSLIRLYDNDTIYVPSIPWYMKIIERVVVNRLSGYVILKLLCDGSLTSSEELWLIPKGAVDFSKIEKETRTSKYHSYDKYYLK